VDRLSNTVHHVIQTFPNSDAVFEDNSALIHTAGTVQSWFGEHELRNRFPPPTSLKQLEDVLQEEWYKIPLQTVQNLYESVPRRTAAVL
jgi:hypothetical protein